MRWDVARVGTVDEKPLADAGSRFLGTTGGAIISAGAIISITGNLNILVLSGSRIPFAMAEQRELPSLLGKLHQRFATPYAAILLTSGVMLISDAEEFLCCRTHDQRDRASELPTRRHALLCQSLRRRADTPRAQFHLPGGPVVAILSLGLIVWLLRIARGKRP